MNRRSLLRGLLASAFVPLAPAILQAKPNYNTYAATMADQGAAARVAKAGDTWQLVFSKKKLELARYLNRQNVQLEQGQVYLTLSHMSAFGRKQLLDLSPLARLVESRSAIVLVDQGDFAWGYYHDGRLVRWGPAVCGGDWCADVGRSCRTPTGQFIITEFAGPDRRSTSYPRELAQEGKGALMPYFMRLTDGGVGMHARYIRGRHETHGCIGMFYNDAKWLNVTLRKQVAPALVVVRG